MIKVNPIQTATVSIVAGMINSTGVSLEPGYLVESD